MTSLRRLAILPITALMVLVSVISAAPLASASKAAIASCDIRYENSTSGSVTTTYNGTYHYTKTYNVPNGAACDVASIRYRQDYSGRDLCAIFQIRYAIPGQAYRYTKAITLCASATDPNWTFFHPAMPDNATYRVHVEKRHWSPAAESSRVRFQHRA